MSAPSPDRVLKLAQLIVRFAPEISLKQIEAGGGKGYLDLISRVTPHEAPDQYTRIENPLLDSFWGIRLPFSTRKDLPTSATLYYQRG